MVGIIADIDNGFRVSIPSYETYEPKFDGCLNVKRRARSATFVHLGRAVFFSRHIGKLMFVSGWRKNRIFGS